MHALREADRARWADAEAWLLRAAPSPQTAAMEWARHCVAVLAAGQKWDVVRVPYAVLHPDFGLDTTPDKLRHQVSELKMSGSMFCDPYRPYLYVMVPPGTDKTWPYDSSPAGVECLGGTRPFIHHVGVPSLDRLAPPGLFWLIPPYSLDSPLADPEHLKQVLRLGPRPDTGTP
ncbi:hypothetical protein [Streptomyces adustus]|uniref:hypothetical protein n=1 Tax=Streptomyces adustus TaxID=1609272 RepID=UPI0037159997